ncbi:MAG: GntG family PLP-dependent aldolase [Dehalococcoidales bacterium]|nr:GntG family PLP-dependent aldolase [Dehalococcoidales bacterium]
MNTIDLRSDTLTLPTREMMQAIAETKLGDDVYGEDPAVNDLEVLSAKMMGKESALFTASGTMSNLIAVTTHTHPGNEIILGDESHIFWYEVGGVSAVGGVVMHTLPNSETGELDADMVSETIRPKNIHYPDTALICLENTHNRCGGIFLTQEYTKSICDIAHSYGIRVHLDGARIFNAAIAQNIPVSKLAGDADSVCFCLSKGLSAPVGSLLCGNQEFIGAARKRRKMLGGGMRQAGIIAAAGTVALQTTVNRLAEDHDNARQLALGLSSIPGISINPEMVQTNIVLFETPEAVPAAEFVKRMEERQVRLLCFGQRLVRAVTHRMVSSHDIAEALNRIEFLIMKL